MMAAALLFVPCTALRRIYEYVIHTHTHTHTYLTFSSRVLTHLHELPYLGT